MIVGSGDENAPRRSFLIWEEPKEGGVLLSEERILVVGNFKAIAVRLFLRPIASTQTT